MVLMFTMFFFLVYILFSYMFMNSFFNQSIFYDFLLFSYSSFDVSISLVFDYISFGFFSSVSFISFNVFLYSIFYMQGTNDMRRFFYLVFMFVMSMMILVFSGNFFTTMIGWDGLGLVSFCLVIFYSNSTSLESGLVTVFSNRIGDVFFIISFVFFYISMSSTWDSSSYFFIYTFGIILFFGAITKSAQIPFSAWLPAAMAAPTPVSSLVHSSTLVTAGIYVLIRFNYLFLLYNYLFMKIFFLLTMLVAGFCAFMENDLKKIVAMSTLSQLGMMMFILSMGIWMMSFMHMMIHAFFKSMLFLSTGSLMNQMEGVQDSRLYGNSSFSYSSFIFFITSCLCLSGFPFFIGFYSKDVIISMNFKISGLLFYYLFIIGCIFTILYSLRLIYESYLKSYKYFLSMNQNETNTFFIPVMLLFFKCWIFGGMFFWFFLISMNFFLYFFDLFVGIILMTLGLSLFFLMKFSYYLYFSLGMIMFLRWKSGSGSTFLNMKNSFTKFENTWLEFIGGSGTYSMILYHNKKIIQIKSIKLGMLLFISFLMIMWLY